VKISQRVFIVLHIPGFHRAAITVMDAVQRATFHDYALVIHGSRSAPTLPVMSLGIDDERL
jgi:hypothetical protein